jgi:SNF2 family DNA or RNA helicase
LFEQVEVRETWLDEIGLRMEGRASQHVPVRGGIIGDGVGFGKTALALAIIDANPKVEEEKEKSWRIPTKATLVLVPSHLVTQWSDEEIPKFLGGTHRVVTIRSSNDFRRLTTTIVQEADIVVVSQSLFESDMYVDSLRLFASAYLPKFATGGRSYLHGKKCLFCPILFVLLTDF